MPRPACVLAPEHTDPLPTAPAPLLKPVPSAAGAYRFEFRGDVSYTYDRYVAEVEEVPRPARPLTLLEEIRRA